MVKTGDNVVSKRIQTLFAFIPEVPTYPVCNARLVIGVAVGE